MNKNKQVPWGRLMASVATGLLAATAQLAQAQSFGACDSRLWISQDDTLYSVGMGTNPFSYTAVGTSSTNINAIDFNTADNFLYGMRSGSSNMLVRLGTSGVAVNVGAVSGLPTAGYINGAFAPAGNLLYVKSGANDNVMYRINVSTRVATAITLSRAITTADFAFVGSTLYSVESDGQLISIATSGSPALVTNIGTPQLPTGFLGAMFGTPSRLYGSHNSGGFYQVDLATGRKTLISSSPPSNANDGAHCPRAELSFGADLAITKTNTPAAGASDQANDRYVPGTAITYTIVVSNNGPFGAANVTVRDPLPSGITSASWTCSGTGGATCPASGTGAIDTSEVSLPVGGKATFLHTLTVPDSRTADLSNTATVSVGAGSTDPDASNNSATDSDPPVARLTVRKISEGGVGSFSFTGSNGVAAHSVTTVTAGTAASGAVQVLTAPNTATTVTESAAAAYLLTGISCTGLGSGSATPNLATRTVSLSAAATAPGAHVICTFTNAKQPVLRLGKALPDGRIQASDQFALSIAGEGGPATATTTGASGAPGETAVLNPASIGSSYTLSESGSGGTDLAAYSSSYSCSNALPGGQAPSGNGTSFTLVPVAGDDLTCLFSNGAAKADLSVSKAVSPGSARTGEVVVYTLTVNNAGPRAADGAVLRDTPGAGLDCSAPATTASCSASGGAACPGATVPVASLTGASGVTLPALPMGGSVVVTLQCTVTASGL